MDQDTVNDLHALFTLVNQQNANREVDRVFRSSTSSTPMSSTVLTATTISTLASTVVTSPSLLASSSTASTPHFLNEGPIFSPNTVPWRGEGHGRVHPYTRIGHQFSRVVVLQVGPIKDNVPCGDFKQAVLEQQHKTQVGQASQEVWTSILNMPFKYRDI